MDERQCSRHRPQQIEGSHGLIRHQFQHQATEKRAAAETDGMDTDQAPGDLALGIRAPCPQDAAVPGGG